MYLHFLGHGVCSLNCKQERVNRVCKTSEGGREGGMHFKRILHMQLK